MLADGVDLDNRGPGSNQHLVGCDYVFERDFVVDRLLGDGRTTAAEQEDDQRRRILGVKRLEHGFGGADRLAVGSRVATEKITKAPNLGSGSHRRGYNSLKVGASLHLQCIHHGVCGLTERDYENAMVGVEVVQVLPNTQDATLANDVLPEGPIDTGFGQSVLENMARNHAHFDGLLV